MGDDLRQGQIPSENYSGRETSPQSLGGSNTNEQNMQFEAYPQQQANIGQYGGSTMDMRNLAGALPDYSMRQYQQQPLHHQFTPQANSTQQNMMYQYQQGQQFAGQTGTNHNFNAQYHPQFIQQHAARQQQQAYAGFQNVQPSTQAFQPQHIQMPEYSHNQQQQYLQIPTGQYVQAYGGRGYQQQQMRPANMTGTAGMPMYQQLMPQPLRRTSSSSSLQGSAIRGPPRKPKQSGHALWVGNLPPGTHIIDLKDHFSIDATSDIESVFLISKSNCAFVNYKTEESCAAAMSRFHDSRFQGVRLVCRLRRGSASAASATQASPITVPSPTDARRSAESLKSEGAIEEESAIDDDTNPEPDPEPIEKVPEKYFVVKSLTIEDLERSLHTGVWATQAHNEQALNKAYQSAETVYLIFSANKSGEYFGYARMDSAINDEAAAAIEAPPRPESIDVQTAVPDLPLTIPTPATATAPKGRIIDDSSRGTIFWEADSDEQNVSKEEEPSDNSGYESAGGGATSPATSQTFGKPFKIVWVSTERLPFYRTRGLRNPWNANREVKIARDGTEIEPGVGRRLVGMFHRPQGASPASRPPMAGMMPMQGGYMPQSQQGGMPGGGGNPYNRMYQN